ncbi:MAG TPA: hypothetical protein ENJ82_17130 [Bacteroidetes bacterium]|nr:hypothetical protein [Bacteroidota bacterium]
MTAEKKNKHAITGYLVIQANMKTVSPLRIGSGKENRADVEVIRMKGKPYVPASGLIGALFHRYKDEVGDPELEEAGEIFWGTEMSKKTDGQQKTWQSHLRVADMELTPAETQAVVRDGVRIDPKTNTAEDGMKFDYELLDPGQTFTFRAEVTLRDGFKEEVGNLKKLLNFLAKCLREELRIGGLTSRGFGVLECLRLRMYHFDFASQDASANDKSREAWFKFLESGIFDENMAMDVADLPKVKEKSFFSIRATFELKSALLIGASPGPDASVDKVQLKSGGKPVISGTSLAGVIRHRCLKVLKTLGVADDRAAEKIGKMFGMVDESKDKKGGKPAIKSRVITHEAVLNGVEAAKQTRIRIDRFTGGVIRSGLFESEPVWRKKGHSVSLRIDLRRPKLGEQALLLHVLKDLWTSDLAIGGEKSIGRGVLKGKTARILFNQDALELKQEGNEVSQKGNADVLAALAEAEDDFSKMIQELTPTTPTTPTTTTTTTTTTKQ